MANKTTGKSWWFFGIKWVEMWYNVNNELLL